MRGLVGKHLSHSFSKQIHEKLDQKEYNLIELNELDSFFQAKLFDGVNVTIPYKTDCIPFLDWVSDSAKEINAVNTIVNENGYLKGYNTDIDGLLYTFDHYGVSIKNKVVGIIGNGATSGTAQYAMKQRGAKEVLVFALYPNANDYTLEEIHNHPNIDIIINATPNGMYPHNDDELIVDLEKFNHIEFVFDVVYNPIKTKLVLSAEELKIKAVNGLLMLIHQAVRANELFNKITYDETVTINLYKDILLSRLNIVVIGMPMSGKSHYAKLIAKRFQKQLIDIDQKIEYTQETSIPEIFKNHGEKGFRKIETQVVNETSKELSQAISTGGGVVLNKQNIDYLRQNGIILFIDAPLDFLKTMNPKNRPLLQDPRNLVKLYDDRYCLYNKYYDIKIVKNSLDSKLYMKEIEVKINEYISTEWS